MRRRSSLIGLVLGAMLLGALGWGATVAAAESPMFYENGFPHVGRAKFSGTLGAGGIVQGPQKLECTGGEVKGTVVGATELTAVKLTLSGCQLPVLHYHCASGSKGNVVRSRALSGSLVLASETIGGTLQPAILFRPKGALDMRYRCAEIGSKMDVLGPILAAVGPVGVPSLSTTLSFATKQQEPEGCTKQQLLYVDGEGPCLHLSAEDVPQVALQSVGEFSYLKPGTALEIRG
jgi:hypothetical protein